MQSEAVRSIVLAHGEFFAGAIAAWVGDRDAPTTQVPPPGPEKLVVQFVVGDIYSIKGSDFGCENTLKAVDRLEKETPFGEVWGLHARIMRALERVQAGARGVIYGVGTEHGGSRRGLHKDEPGRSMNGSQNPATVSWIFRIACQVHSFLIRLPKN
jgi:hypothetical protein